MLSTSFMLLVSGAFLMLRLGETAGSFPRPLPAKEERRCVEAALGGDMDARNTLIEHNLRLVVHIVKKYYAASADAEDLISIGTVGLIKGVSSYRPDKGVRLATYASRCIENEILMHFRSLRKSAQDVSLSDALDPDGDGSGGLSLMDTLAVPDDMLEELSRQEQRRLLRAAVDAVLDERERTVVTMRYGLDGTPPQPQRSVAETLGISRSYVSRIEKKALEKLKAQLEGEKPQPRRTKDAKNT